MQDESDANLQAAVKALKAGDVIVFPTETLYGLGADALNDDAVSTVFRLKGRDPNIPIPVLIADETMLSLLVDQVPPLAQRLIQNFWPGPLTLVLTAREGIPKPLLNPAGGVGLRISSQPLAARLVRGLGRPLTATSANPSGKPPARTLGEAKNYFNGDVRVFIDGGPLTSKTGSTVAEVQGDHLRIIRHGEVDRATLENLIGEGKLL